MTDDAAGTEPQDATPAGDPPRPSLVRPVHGRYLAGVCAALGRATNTDPVLWRVLLAVLTLFGGVGLLAYLVGWMLIPGEGDTASPLEALVGRGDSNTSPLTVVLASVIAVLIFVFVISDGFRVAVLGTAAVVAALLLFQRGALVRAPGPPSPGVPPVPVPEPPLPAGYAPSVAAGYAPSVATGYAPTGATGYAPPAATALGPPAATGYRPPFAPHGPFVPPPPPPVPVPPAPKPPREPSRLGRITVSVLCLALGVLGVVDLFIADVPAEAYFAVALAITGVALVVGAWFGRARWLILAGLALALALGLTSVATSERFTTYWAREPVLWQPASINDLSRQYHVNVGNATLDLRNVDFSTAATPVPVDVTAAFGELRIILPPNVDVAASVRIDNGSAYAFGVEWNGVDLDTRSFNDNGGDGPGGGELVLVANVDLGRLEVVR